MKNFKRNDQAFICDNCHKFVNILNYTSRDHCPYCLYSKHIDINPGDRLNTCLGLMKPVDIEKFKNTFKIIYKCSKCGQMHKNIMAQDDDMNMIINISSNKK